MENFQRESQFKQTNQTGTLNKRIQLKRPHNAAERDATINGFYHPLTLPILVPKLLFCVTPNQGS